MSLDTLIEHIKKLNNPTAIGLDTNLSYVPEYLQQKAFEKHGKTLKGAAKAILYFNKGIIDAVCDIAPAVKLQAAYYEMYGYAGMKTLYLTEEYAKLHGMYVITDAKRNDIGATMEAYATAHLGITSVSDISIPAFMNDSLTVNGYLGTDGIKPLIEACKTFDKSIFVLVKTSNPSSGELQDLMLEDGNTVYQKMGDMCEAWGATTVGRFGYSAVGAVVGATYPDQLTELRRRLPHTFFLIPGFGTQGGKASDIAGAFDENGIGGIVNNSRGIMLAYKNEKGCKEEDYAAAAFRAAEKMKNELGVVLAK